MLAQKCLKRLKTSGVIFRVIGGYVDVTMLLEMTKYVLCNGPYTRHAPITNECLHQCSDDGCVGDPRDMVRGVGWWRRDGDVSRVQELGQYRLDRVGATAQGMIMPATSTVADS